MIRSLLILVFGSVFFGAYYPSNTNTPIFYRSFYLEMKALEKPAKVTAAAARQTASGSSTFATSTAVTVSSTLSNSLLVVSIYMTATSITYTSTTDNQSSSYTTLGPVNTGGGANGKIYQAYAICASGVTTVTVAHSSGSFVSVIVNEYTGVDAADPYDIHATGSSTGTSASVTLSPSIAGNLIVATIGTYLGDTPNGVTSGSGYTRYGINTYASTYDVLAAQYKLIGTTSETAPATISYGFDDEWCEIATSFNIAPAPDAAPALNAAGNIAKTKYKYKP